MKKQFIALLFWFLTGGIMAQTMPRSTLQPRVDERVELLSILARLADYEEYSLTPYKAYVAAIEQHFGHYKKHPAVAYMRQVRIRRQIGYDAVMSYAIQLGPTPDLHPLVPFRQHLPDSRWAVTDANHLAGLVQQFYRDAHCAAFFRQQQPRYQLAERRFREVTKQVDIPWYSRFYGNSPTQVFNVLVAVGNGGSNFGPHLRVGNGSETVYAIMGTWATDSTGEAHYTTADYLPIIIHEFNHSFVNPLIDKHRVQLTKPAATIYEQVKEPMQQQAYGNGHTMLCEALVRATVVVYLEQHKLDGTSAREALRDEERNSFIWIDSLITLLHRYEASRKQYPTLAAFMPEHNAFYQRLAPRIALAIQDYNNQLPVVEAIEPFINGSQTVDSATQEIRIRFSKPMSPAKIGIQMSEGGRKEMPLRDVHGFSDDNRTLRAVLVLKPNQPYSFKLTSRFQTPDGYAIKPYTVAFKTAAAL